MLKKWRIDAELSQAEFAEEVGVSQNTVSYWETGRTTPNVAMIKKIAAALNVSPLDVFLYFSEKLEKKGGANEA